MIVKVRSILSGFPGNGKKRVPLLTQKSLPTATKGINKMYDDYIKVEKDLKKFKSLKKSIKNKIEILNIANKNKLNLKDLKNSQILSCFAGTIIKEDIQKKLEQVNGDLKLFKNKKYILIVCKNNREEQVRSILTESGFNEVKLEVSKDVSQEITSSISEEEKIEEKEKDLFKQLLKIKNELSTLAGIEERLEEEIRKQELPLNFAVTETSFVAEGWVPKNKQSLIEEQLKNATANSIHITFTTPEKKENPPVKLNNKKLVTPFEFLLKLYDLPKYNEIDPTSIFFITFPLFFGFMLGDIGYGLVLLGAFYLLKKKMPAAAQLASILMFAASMSIIFGFIFGEFFGFEHLSIETGRSLCNSVNICLPEHNIISHGVETTVADFPRLLNRVHSQINVLGFDILSVLVIGAFVGFLHLNFGFILGFINEFKQHGFKHALQAKLSWMIVELGIILAILANLNIITPYLLWPGVVIAIAGVILLGVGEGIQGIVELPALFSNTLSYMRLGAVGLASVGLAVVVNENLALPFIEKGGIFIVIGIIIMLLGHGINILLGVIGPFLHGIRLHYVELFSKFFQGGGVEYEPFSKKQIDTEE